MFLALGVWEALDDFVDKELHVVVFHVEWLFEFLVFLFIFFKDEFWVLDGLPELIGLVGDVDEIVLEVIVFIVELYDLLL